MVIIAMCLSQAGGCYHDERSPGGQDPFVMRVNCMEPQSIVSLSGSGSGLTNHVLTCLKVQMEKVPVYEAGASKVLLSIPTETTCVDASKMLVDFAGPGLLLWTYDDESPTALSKSSTHLPRNGRLIWHRSLAQPGKQLPAKQSRPCNPLNWWLSHASFDTCT